jgi:hypothetical protein
MLSYYSRTYAHQFLKPLLATVMHLLGRRILVLSNILHEHASNNDCTTGGKRPGLNN